MGYTTDFYGQFHITPRVKPEHEAYINKFSYTRRMKRDEKLTALLPDPIRLAVGLPVGVEGGFYVGSSGEFGQERSNDVIEYNSPPKGQPGLWCQWIVVQPEDKPDFSWLQWDYGEKFYDYTEWLRYLIEYFFHPWGYTLDGEVEWQGEDHGDMGIIVIKNNVVLEKYGRIVYED